ncbi:MATH/TRAF domain-containing protein [Hirschfeldia incana]|nr:MATH/TRAF domain-containing protein [Hirschfeldia incana]
MVSTFEDTIKGQLTVRRNSHFMMVDGMSKLMTRKVNQCWSSDFHIAGLQWRLVISWKNAQKDNLYLRLRITDKKCTGSSWNVKCRGIFSLVGERGNHHLLESFPACFKEDTKPNPKSIPWGTLKQWFLVNDKAVFMTEIINVVASFPVTPIARNMGTAECIKLIEVPQNNSRFTWKITRFSSFSGKRHSSYEFTVGPRRWKIMMYPEGKAGNFSLYLVASDYVTSSPKRPTFANYKLRVLDQVNRNHHESGTYTEFPFLGLPLYTVKHL